MSDRSSILQAKARLPLPELLRSLGFQPPASGSGNMSSPFRSGDHQSSPSFSIFERAGSWGWVDRSGGSEEKGDEIVLLEKLENLSRKDAIVRYLALAGVQDVPLIEASRPFRQSGSASPASPPPSWDDVSAAFSPAQQGKLASWRGYSLELVSWLHEQGLLGSYQGSPCLPVRDASSGRLLAVHVRPESGRWFYEPKGAGTHPLILGNLASAEITAIFESQWDLFAALEGMKFHLDPDPKIAFICTRGASNGRLAALARGKVYAFPQNDPEKNGKQAGEEWLKAVVAAVPGEVFRVDTPAEFPDLNDWLRSGEIGEALKAAIEAARLVPRHYVSKLEAELEEAVSSGESPAPFDPLAICEKIGLWWLDGSESYFIQSGEGKNLVFRELKAAAVKRKLKSLCLKSSPERDAIDPLDRSLSQCDRVLLVASESRAVDFAGAVAGNYAGVYELQGGRLIVKNSPKLIEPVVGGLCPVISELMKGVLGDEGALMVCYWLKIAYEALRKGERRPGQCLILAGPPGCGKSFIQHQIITPILAGRSADPKDYFFKHTAFNSELTGAEHLLIEEVPSSNHHEGRLTFGEKIKEIVANDTERLHKKNRDAFMVKALHRISITINDDPQKLKVLPPLTGDLTEKLIMLQAKECPSFWQKFDSADDPRRAIREAIESELPSFCHGLLELEIPEAMRSGQEGRRYGVNSYVNEELALMLFENEPEAQLLLLIDKELFGPKAPYAGEEWTGDAEDLKQFLTSDNRDSKRTALKLLDYSSACGQLLGRLAKKFPHRVRNHRKSDWRGWIIAPPGGVTHHQDDDPL